MSDDDTLHDRPLQSDSDARHVLCALLRRFYDRGWVSGTGGGLALRHDGHVYMAPSGVQKELVTPASLFVLNAAGDVVERPADASLTLSQCRPLFWAAMQQRDAGAVIHTHSQAAVLATLLDPGADRVVLHELEMLKGLRGVGYHDRHAVPVIDNTAHEADLADSLSAALDAFPLSHAVLVRRHGLYVWGRDWREAKRHAECYDWLFDVTVKLALLGPVRRVEGER